MYVFIENSMLEPYNEHIFAILANMKCEVKKIERHTKKRRRGTARNFVYSVLKQQIINLEIKPNTKISEQDIANQLEVSRTPVREAFLKLSQENLVEIFPQQGTFVSEIDLDLVEEGRFVRETLERAVVREACTKLSDDQLFQLESNIAMQKLCLEKGSFQRLFELDEQFHRLLFEGCNKLRTWALISQMNSHFDRLRMLRLSSNPDWKVVVSQHKEIFESVSRKNLDKAEKVMMKHLNLVNYEKNELIARYPDYFRIS